MQQEIVLAIFKTVENLNKRKKENSTRKLTKLVGNNSLPFWLPKAFLELDAIIRTRGIPLSYMICEDVVAPAGDQLIQGQAYSQENGSITDKLIQRATHNHPLNKEDDCMLFDKLYNVFWGSEVETTITSKMKQIDKAGHYGLLRKLSGLAATVGMQSFPRIERSTKTSSLLVQVRSILFGNMLPNFVLYSHSYN